MGAFFGFRRRVASWLVVVVFVVAWFSLLLLLCCSKKNEKTGRRSIVVEFFSIGGDVGMCLFVFVFVLAQNLHLKPVAGADLKMS